MRAELLAIVIPDAVCVGLCAIAAGIDVRRYRIPNWLTVTGAVLGLVLNVALPLAVADVDAMWTVAGRAVLGGALLLAATLPLGGLGLLGFGDVKLLTAVGLLVRWPLALPVLAYTAIAGGFIALVLMATRRSRATTTDSPDRRMPYGGAILVGVAWAVAARYEAALRLLG